MATILRVYCLDGFRLEFEAGSENQIAPKPPTLKSQSLLAYLILRRQRPSPREKLIDMFWGDRPPRKARRSLSTALWYIRRCLPEPYTLPGDNFAVQFHAQDDLWLDVDHFMALTAQTNTIALQTVVDLYQSDFLEGYFDDWIINERYRLQARYFDALTHLLRHYETAVQPQSALQTALTLLHHDPLREDAHRSAMLAYAQLGQRQTALSQYQLCQQTLAVELDIAPARETTQLYKSIVAGAVKPVLAAPGFAPPRLTKTAVPETTHLPVDAPWQWPLVGREYELAWLETHWQETVDGRGKLLLVVGEAGIGKTRLVETFAAQIRQSGAPVLYGRCYEFERLLPYQPVAEALRPLVQTLDQDDLRLLPDWVVQEIGRLLPDLLEKRPDLPPASAPAQEWEQSRLFNAIVRLLAALSARQAVLLWLEDCHWATESTQQLIHYLARHLVERPVLFIYSFREAAASQRHAFTAIQRQWQKDGLAEKISLTRLTPQDVTRLVDAVMGSEETAVPLAERLYKETEGNTFFLIEMMKSLREMGLLTAAGAAQADHIHIPRPTSIDEAIQARARRLPENSQNALRVTAVLGREFDFELLHASWGQTEEETLTALDDLLRYQLISEGQGLSERDYLFTHHKIQEVVYANLPVRQRQHLHVLAGQAMENVYVNQLDTFVAELAHHFDHGRKLKRSLKAKAANYFKQAGQQAAAQFANADALVYFNRALELTAVNDMTTRFDLILARTAIYDLMGNRQAQSDDLQSLSSIANELKDDQIASEIAIQQARYQYAIGNYPGAISAAQTALQHARNGHDIQLEAEAAYQWGASLWMQGKYPAAQAQLEQAVHLAKKCGALETEANSLKGLGLAAKDQGEYAVAKEQYQSAMSIFEQLGLRRSQAQTLGNIGIIFRNEGDYAAAQDYLERSLAVFCQIGDRYYEGIMRLNLGVILWDQSALSAAQEYLKESLSISQEVEDVSGTGLALNNLGRLAAEQGDFAAAQAYLERALPIYQQTGERQGESSVLQSLGNVNDWRGQYTAAVAYHRQALEIRRQIGDRRGEGYCLRSLADALLELKNFSEVTQAYQQALTIFQEIGEQRGVGEAYRGLGQLMMSLGDFASAERYFEQALAHFHSQRDEATVFYRLGWLYHSQGDHNRALEHGRNTLSASQELSSRPLQATAFTLLGHALAAQQHLAEAHDAFTQALALRREMEQHHLVMEALAGLALVTLAQGDKAETLRLVEKIWPVLSIPNVDESGHDLIIYLICAEALQAHEDGRARQLITTAYKHLQTQAATIPDDTNRHTFLNNVPTHRAILAAYKILTTSSF